MKISMLTAAMLAVAAPARAAVPVFVFAGQSNMSGSFGEGPEGCPLPEPAAPYAYYMETQGGSVLHEDTWGDLRILTVAGGDTINAFGPELAFMCRVFETLPAPESGPRALVIKTTANGTALEKYWLPGRPRMLFENMVAKIQDELALREEDWEFAAFVWVQGEDDAVRADFAPNYGANMATFAAAVRAALGAPDLPIVDSQLSPAAVMEFTALVREGKASFHAADPASTLVETADLELRDGVHYSTPARNVLGQRLAEAYLRLTCPGDLNADGIVNSPDLGILIGAFGQVADQSTLPADINRDGVVNTADLSALLARFAMPCAP